MIRIKRFDESIKEIVSSIEIVKIADNILDKHFIYHFVKKKGVLDKIIYKDTKRTLVADYRIENGKDVIVLYNNFVDFYNREGEKWAEEVLLHEVAHAFLDWYGMSKLMEKGYEYGIDVFDVNSLPFGEADFHEAFAQMTSLILLKDREAKNLFPNWWEMVYDILKESGVL